MKEIPAFIDKRKVIAQYEAIRRSGQTNMFSRTAVQLIAFENGFFELVVAIDQGCYGYILKNYSELMKLISESDIPVAKKVTVVSW